jgi:hypothetical protein
MTLLAIIPITVSFSPPLASAGHGYAHPLRSSPSRSAKQSADHPLQITPRPTSSPRLAKKISLGACLPAPPLHRPRKTIPHSTRG